MDIWKNIQKTNQMKLNRSKQNIIEQERVDLG
jgi:hypothetical protein